MIGANIKNLRIQKRLTQTQLAELLNVSQATIAGWERETRQPDYQTVASLAEVFGVTTDEIIGYSNNPEPVDDLTFALNGETRDLTEAEKQDVLAYIRFRKSQRKSAE